jgi:hypothetical protein
MLEPEAIRFSLIASLDAAERSDLPFPHWLPTGMLPGDVIQQIDALPVEPPQAEEMIGKRENQNTRRYFFNGQARLDHEVCDQLAQALQGADFVNRLAELTGARLKEGYLRIEYCLDTNGFWLEPHTDSELKLLTMSIYLSRDAGADEWGTDLYDRHQKLVKTARYQRNCGLIFVPTETAWHGFRKRPIPGVRRSLVVSYVKPEWRGREELAFPHRLAGD